METDIILQEGFKLIEEHLINIEHGLKILIVVAVGFFVWKVIKVIYKLFGGIFFGGV